VAAFLLLPDQPHEFLVVFFLGIQDLFQHYPARAPQTTSARVATCCATAAVGVSFGCDYMMYPYLYSEVSTRFLLLLKMFGVPQASRR
jgi:hypothetical protein